MRNILGRLLILICLSGVRPMASGQTADPAPSVSPATPAEASPSGGKRAREFQGDDLGQVLRLLARQAKISLMIDDAIKGSVNVRLENASAMETIEAIVHQYKLAMTKDEKGVYFLSPPDPNDAALDLLAKPETANRIAAYVRHFYLALAKEGFTPEESLRIVTAFGPGEMSAAMGQRPGAPSTK